jgi:hypothetical protein
VDQEKKKRLCEATLTGHPYTFLLDYHAYYLWNFVLLIVAAHIPSIYFYVLLLLLNTPLISFVLGLGSFLMFFNFIKRYLPYPSFSFQFEFADASSKYTSGKRNIFIQAK